jgi:hypothetical protein
MVARAVIVADIAHTENRNQAVEVVVDMRRHMVEAVVEEGSRNPRPQQEVTSLLVRNFGLGTYCGCHSLCEVVPVGNHTVVVVATAWIAGRVAVAGNHRDWQSVPMLWMWARVGSMLPALLAN